MFSFTNSSSEKSQVTFITLNVLCRSQVSILVTLQTNLLLFRDKMDCDNVFKYLIFGPKDINSLQRNRCRKVCSISFHSVAFKVQVIPFCILNLIGHFTQATNFIQ